MIGFTAFVLPIAPKVFHEEWLKQGSAYPVEDEFFNFGVVGHLRDNLYSFGLPHDSLISTILYEKQRSIMERAFEKIPESDGERLVWQLNLDQDFLDQVALGNNVSQVMPRTLKYFDALINAKYASKWAEIQAYDRSRQMAGYYFKQYRKAGFYRSEQIYWLNHILFALNERVDKFEPENFIRFSLPEAQVIPLTWNDIILVGTAGILLDPDTGEVNCDYRVLNIALKTKQRLERYIPYYQSMQDKLFIRQSVDIATRNLNGYSEWFPKFFENCPNLKEE